MGMQKLLGNGKEMGQTGQNTPSRQADGEADDMQKKQAKKELIDALWAARMSQTDLANETKMHLTHINAIVHGSRPNVDTAIKIARALGTTVEALWGGDVPSGNVDQGRSD